LAQKIAVQCCIAGGGPAGMMLGYLLGRAGVGTLVLEKHADFLRDFRGDTVHPSTLEIMRDLGLLEEFLRQPHTEIRALSVDIGGRSFKVADFGRLPAPCNFIALMPQWDFLNFLLEKSRRFSALTTMLSTEVTGLTESAGRVAGVKAIGPSGAIEVTADLVVGCDGRTSTVRHAAALEVQDLGAPIDVLWFRLSQKSVDRLNSWSKPGILCIGDAAHAMSPVGGVGINLAIQDAVATANLLAAKLKAGTLTADDLDAVRRRRLFPVSVIQAIQVAVHNRVLRAVISGGRRNGTVPLAIKVLDKSPWLRRWPAQIMGLGLRREQVRSPDAHATRAV
jgi:2-polyprenyl-6-methoxyphenol hydroxylase-like FAD-dependent oxidoreductase